MLIHIPMSISLIEKLSLFISYLLPLDHNNVGKNSFTWLGPKPQVNITNPEDLKDIFTKYDDFPKLVPTYKKLVAAGFATLEGEKWARHRKIINPAFHLEKLKVRITVLLPLFIYI